MSTATITRPPAHTDREELVELLRRVALVKEDVTLSSGAKAEYLVDAKRVVMSPTGFQIIGRLVREQIAQLDATAVGGLTLGADPIAYATLAVGANAKVFVVRKEPKEHGLRQPIEGPSLTGNDRCLVVDDVVTTGKSTLTAIHALMDRGLTICGVVCLCDRLAGGGTAIREEIGSAPYRALTTIDEVYPERPDR